MEIQIIVPWASNGNLGSAYNQAMKNVDDWVCFLDHDILQLNSNWYHMCLSMIKQLGHSAGWITGVTNAIACSWQFCPNAPKNNDIIDHMKFAKTRITEYGNKLSLMDPATMGLPFSGFMILTHKKAWQDTGGFDNGFLGVDNNYFNKLVKAGYKTYVAKGLYMYHIYGQKKLWDTF